MKISCFSGGELIRPRPSSDQLGRGKEAIDIFVKTTFLIILAFSILNGLTSFLIYLSSRRDLHLRTGLFWAALTVNFLVQASAQGSELRIILSFGFAVVPLNLLAFASLGFTDAKYPARLFASLSVAVLGLTALLEQTELGFTAKAMPIAVAAALPLLYTIYCFKRAPKRGAMTPLMAAHAFVLFLLAVHSINFAVFRMVPEAQLWGWPVAYGLYQIMAAVFPALTMDFIHLEEADRLRQTIAARTLELTEANARLNRLVERKEFLAKTLTHDISNPLAVIDGKLKLAERGIKDQRKFLKDLGEMTARIVRLITQVRNFEAVDQRLNAHALELVSLRTCLHEMRELFEDRLRAKNIDLIFDEHALADAFARVERASFLGSVLPNLISNAIKFSHAGSAVRVSVRPRAANQISLFVEDHGLGITPKALASVFTFGLNQSRVGTDGETGTGFGLPILARTVEAYGGEVLVESRPEGPTASGWTRFEVRLGGYVVHRETAA